MCKPQLTDIDTCGLHVVHGPFQTRNRVAGWKLNDTLRSMYRLYKGIAAIY